MSELLKLVGHWRKDIMIWDSQENLLRLAYVEVELQEIRKALGAFIEEDPVSLANSVTTKALRTFPRNDTPHRTVTD